MAVLERNPKPLSLGERVFLFSVAVGALAGTYAVIFAVDGTFRNGHYSYWSAGVQGRYAIPYCLAGLLAMQPRRAGAASPLLAPTVLSVSTVYGLLALGSVARHFYL